MENYQMNRTGCRPYNRTCGMMKPTPLPEPVTRTQRQCFASKIEDCNCRMPGMAGKQREMYAHLEHLEPAMAYVPCQKFTTIFELGKALHMGTIFPELCKPFCGKRGRRR